MAAIFETNLDLNVVSIKALTASDNWYSSVTVSPGSKSLSSSSLLFLSSRVLFLFLVGPLPDTVGILYTLFVYSVYCILCILYIVYSILYTLYTLYCILYIVYSVFIITTQHKIECDYAQCQSNILHQQRSNPYPHLGVHLRWVRHNSWEIILNFNSHVIMWSAFNVIGIHIRLNYLRIYPHLFCMVHPLHMFLSGETICL